MPYHSIFLQRAVRAGPLLVRPPCVLFLRHGLLSPSVFLVVILLWYPHGFLLPVAESLPHADGNEFLPDSRRALKRRVSPTGVQAFSENTEPDASPSSLHMRRHVGDRGSRSVEQKTETPGKSRVQQASISGASKQHEGKERNFLSYTDRTSGQEKAKKTLEAADTATARDVRLLADGTPPLLANNVLSVSTILGQQDTEVTCPGKKVISLAALFREGDAAGILKFLVDGSLDFSRWPSPQNGYGAGVTGVSAAAKAENPREEEPEKRAPRRAAAGTGSLPSQQPCEAEIQAGSVNEFPQKQGSNGDLGESGCQLGDSTGEERQEEPRLFSDAGSEVSPAADVHDSQRSRANSPGRVYQRADPPPTGEVESRKEENTGSNGAEDPAAGNDEERLQETKKEELMAVNRFLHTSAKSLLESPLASKGLNLGDLVCRALSHPLVGTASFCSVLEVIRMQV
ncbi:lipase, partial [Cystoisospora suis]